MNYNNELYHHGVIGMKWGVRRYQNADGSLTPAGQKRLAAYKQRHSTFARNTSVEGYNQNMVASNRYAQIAEKARRSGNKKKEERALTKSKAFATEAKSAAEMGKKQLEKISKMSYQDMMAEKRKTAKTEAAYIAGVTLISVATIPVSKIPLILPIVSSDAIAYNTRAKEILNSK